MKYFIIILLGFSITAAEFIPVKEYADSWDMDSSIMNDDTLMRSIIIYSLYPLPNQPLISKDGNILLFSNDTVDIYSAAHGLASGSFGSVEMQEAFRKNCWENIASTFKFYYLMPCIKKDISRRWECIGWIFEVSDWIGLPKEGFSDIEVGVISFIADISQWYVTSKQH